MVIKDIMDNFHFVKLKPSIERSEVNSIRDTIFQRAREKAQKMNEEQNAQYSANVKNDIMEIASNDFRSTEFNPFNKFKESLGLNKSETEPQQTIEEPEVQPTTKKTYEIKPLKRNIESVSDNTYANSVKDETMSVARNQFRQQQNLTTSLNFLNAQAAIQMAKYAHSKINYLS